MSSPVEVIPGWEEINGRLDCTLSQLNRLIHHYANEPIDENTSGETDPERQEELGCQSEECLETDINDILRDTRKTLTEFTESLGLTSLKFDDQRGRQAREANEESQSLTRAESQISSLKEQLAQAQNEVANLHQRLRDTENVMDEFRREGVPNIKTSRELERTKAELLDKAKELESTRASKEKIEKELLDYKKTIQTELEREKLKMQRESRELKENFQNEMMTTTQQHVEREIELQDFCQREKDAHSKTIKDMMTLHTEEVKKLKAEHAIKLEDCCQNHASLEAEWMDKEFELNKQIAEAVQEKSRYIHLLFDENLKVQDLEVQLARVQSDLSIEKLAKSQVENELKFSRVDVSLANEKLRMGLKAHEHTQSIVASVQDEMMNMKRTSAADVARLEEKAFALQKNLSCVTNTCVQSEHELHTQSRKLEELQQNVSCKQKDLLNTTTELQKLQQEVQSLQNDIKAKDHEKRALQKNYEAQCQQLQTTIFKLQMEEKQKCEDLLLKTQDTYEIKLQRQAKQHKDTIQKLQQQFRMQWDEHMRNVEFNREFNSVRKC